MVRWSPSQLGKLHRVSVPVSCKGAVAETEPAIRQGHDPGTDQRPLAARAALNAASASETTKWICQ